MKTLSKSVHPFVTCAVMAIAAPFAAQAQEACAPYTVRDGDSLGSIAQAAYGTFDYQIIFNANREVLAGNPNNLKAGLELKLPCKDGRLSADAELSSIIEAEEAKQAATAKKSNVYEPPLKFVSGNEWKPFTDETLNGGGMLVRIATTALQRGGNNRESTVSWVDDWGSHIDTLLPSGAYDISVAWAETDCSNVSALPPDGQKRCTDFEYSLPVYEVAESFMTLPDNKYAAAETYEDFKDSRFCRPADWPFDKLELRGIKEPFVKFVRPKTPNECAEMLLAGEVDIYSIELETATDNFTKLGAMDKIVANPNLSEIVSFRLVTSKFNPRGRIYIAMLNKGLTEMRKTGEWYDIVATSLSDYNKLSN